MRSGPRRNSNEPPGPGFAPLTAGTKDMRMTEELAIGHYFKRLTAIQYEFGTTDSHLARYAELTKA